MAALKLSKTADGLGATFPEDVLTQFNLREGDVLELSQTANGILLTRAEHPLSEEMALARTIMDENAAVLAVLAK